MQKFISQICRLHSGRFQDIFSIIISIFYLILSSYLSLKHIPSPTWNKVCILVFLTPKFERKAIADNIKGAGSSVASAFYSSVEKFWFKKHAAALQRINLISTCFARILIPSNYPVRYGY